MPVSNALQDMRSAQGTYDMPAQHLPDVTINIRLDDSVTSLFS